MAQDIVRAAQEKLKTVSETIAVLEKQLAAAHTERNDLQAFLRTYQRLTAPAPIAKDSLFVSLGKFVSAMPQAVEASETLRTALVAREIIQREGKPIKLGDLYNLVTATGQTFGGLNPVNTFAARLSNSRDRARLISLPGVGWWLADRPWQEAGYAPGSETQISDPDT